MPTAIRYTTPTLKSSDNVKPKRHSHKHKSDNGNDNNNKRSKRNNTKKHKMPRHNVMNKNYVKLEHSKHNKPSEIQVEPSPRATGKLVNKKKLFVMKSKNTSMKHGHIVKLLVKLEKFHHNLDKFLHKLNEYPKFTKHMMTMKNYPDKNNMRLTILHVKGVIIPVPNTMKSNDTAS